MKQAVLILSSEKIPQGKRPATPSEWNRLYQVADCYLDLGLRLEGTQRVLVGHLLRPEGAPGLGEPVLITLKKPDGSQLQKEITPNLPFQLPLEEGCGLELTLEGTTYWVPLPQSTA
ncbi:MAG: hypothetical protein NZ849_05280 [Meiothermus sp.]|uniref:hypothetical protein n=1 Tax=Meiothermus sp. TaxID=1955249 RepID=UPI0025DC3254|nr:hypothetical protein [Meiothermus sp.]MCS7058352.1 hypothetical protein [Meiothermus sp.]MCS7194313.1 hypothetical protein [Meiothermus sp.]MCX7740682.1 hypothetical protein [Meiothermus sp.]MDW8090671.1 hypothetical protein [Meiothermus sp.]MDW8482573.1 hypothetical protein [Meiothermus sp.]